MDGRPAFARAADVDEIAATRPSEVVRLLPGFDQFLLGPGTADTTILDAVRRPAVSRAAGWISPVVVAGGRVAGTWEVSGPVLAVVLFEEAAVAADALAAEAARIAAILGQSLRLAVRTT